MTDAEPGTGTPEPDFEGHPNRECGEHRTVGAHRAWCHDCGEWCYPSSPCARCELSALRAAVSAQGADTPADVDDLLAENEMMLAQHARDTDEIERLRGQRDAALALADDLDREATGHTPPDYVRRTTAARIRAALGATTDPYEGGQHG